jgi:hypothetical protein
MMARYETVERGAVSSCVFHREYRCCGYKLAHLSRYKDSVCPGAGKKGCPLLTESIVVGVERTERYEQSRSRCEFCGKATLHSKLITGHGGPGHQSPHYICDKCYARLRAEREPIEVNGYDLCFDTPLKTKKQSDAEWDRDFKAARR